MTAAARPQTSEGGLNRRNARWVGVSFPSPAFEPEHLPGRCDANYTWPQKQDYDFHHRMGFDRYRLLVRWERLQHEPFGDLDEGYLKQLDHTLSLGEKQILTLHNFGRYFPRGGAIQTASRGVVGEDVPAAAFTDVWRRLAERYGQDEQLVFEPMNHFGDPGPDGERAVRLANAALAGIRAAGAVNEALIALGGFIEARPVGLDADHLPLLDRYDDIDDDRWIMSVHQHVHEGPHCVGGAAAPCPHQWLEALRFLTSELKLRRWSAFVTELGISRTHLVSDPARRENFKSLLDHLVRHRDVWRGWCWWASGPWWPAHYEMDLTPGKEGRIHDTAAHQVLRPYLKEHE